MKRKLLLSLGAISAFTPIVAVIACGKIVEPSSDQLNWYRKLSSAETQRVFEQKWAETVIKAQDLTAHPEFDVLPKPNDSNVVTGTVKNPDGTDRSVTIVDRNGIYVETGMYKLDVTKSAALKEVAFYIVRNEIAKDAKYLSNIAGNLLGDKVKNWTDWDKVGGAAVTLDYLAENGFTLYNYGDVKYSATKPATGSAVTDEALNILLNYGKSDFRVKVYRQLVAEAYLNTNKDNYSKAFIRNSRNFDLTQQAIKADEFVLTNTAWSQKLFAQWQIKLDKDASLGFLSKSVTKLDDIKASFKKGGDLYSLANFSDKERRSHEITTVTNTDFILSSADYSGLVGWKGFNTQTAVGTKGSLAFSSEDYLNKELNKIDSSSKWVGVVLKDGLAIEGDKINYVDKANQQSLVDMTFQVGIMPIWKDSKLTFEGTSFNKVQVARLLAYKDQNIYKTASEYFRTKFDGHEAITIKPAYDFQVKILEDANFEFIKERTAE